MTKTQLDYLKAVANHMLTNGPQYDSDVAKVIQAAVDVLQDLPITADGVLVEPDAEVWFYYQGKIAGDRINQAVPRWAPVPLVRCYSTKAAAEAAGEGK